MSDSPVVSDQRGGARPLDAAVGVDRGQPPYSTVENAKNAVRNSNSLASMCIRCPYLLACGDLLAAAGFERMRGHGRGDWPMACNASALVFGWRSGTGGRP